MARRRGEIVFIVGLAGAAAMPGCSPRETRAVADADSGPTASAVAAPLLSGAIDAAAPSRAARWAGPSSHLADRPSCRAVTVEGDVRRPVQGLAADASAPWPEFDLAGPTAPLATGAEIPQDAWITLGLGARLVAKDPRTTRETLFRGPATIRACVGHREESWVSAGIFESEHGAGETPGAEEWVVTPNAVVRFAAAKLAIDATSPATQVTVSNGVAFVWPADDARVEPASGAHSPGDAGPAFSAGAADPWQRAGEGVLRVVSTVSAAGFQAARSSVNRCASIARRAQDLTRALLAAAPAPPDGGGGERSSAAIIIDQVSTRGVARAACAVATVRVSALPRSKARTDLSKVLGEADDAWTALPIAPASSAPPAPSAAP